MNIKKLTRLFLLAWCVWALPNLCLAQVNLGVPQVSLTVEITELDNNARNLLTQVEQYLQEQEWADAIESVRRIYDDYGNQLIAVGSIGRKDRDKFGYYNDLRTHLQTQLSRIGRTSPAVLDVYRDQVDPVAEKLFLQAKQSRDLVLLKRITQEYLLSSIGDDALLLLGDIYLEQANYSAARLAWEQISPRMRTPEHDLYVLLALPGQPLWIAVDGVDWQQELEEIKKQLLTAEPSIDHLSYPDTDIPLPDVLARLVLISHLEGSHRRAVAELQVIENLFPEAIGQIAGKKVNYATFLSELLKQGPVVNLQSHQVKQWPTFAGNQQRNSTATGKLSRHLKYLWTTDSKINYVPSLGANSQDVDRRIAEHGNTLLSYHPVVIGENLFLSDEEVVRGLNKKTGNAAWKILFPPGQQAKLPGEFYRSNKIPPSRMEFGQRFGPRRSRSSEALNYTVGVPRYTLSSWNHLLFARVGSSLISTPAALSSFFEPADILVFNTASEGKLVSVISANENGGRQWSFEGTGISDGSRLYIGMTKNGIRNVAAVACFDVQSARMLWRKEICSTEPYGSGLVIQGDVGDRSHNLLTLSDGALYYNTNRGAIAAIDSSSGKLLWETTYPRTEPRVGSLRDVNLALQRDLNPCIVAQGLVIVMPTDCDRLFALDSATGKKVWQTVPGSLRAVHLLGATDENVLLSGDQLFWVDVYSGRVRAEFPGENTVPRLKSETPLIGFGRGVIVGESLLFPSRSAISILKTKLNEENKVQVVEEIVDLAKYKIPSGNLIADEDLLFISGVNRLTALRWQQE